MVGWTLKFTRSAASDSLHLKRAGLKEKTERLLQILTENPLQTPPTFEKLLGLENVYSRRIDIKHRLVYEICFNEKCVKILSM